ncbi:MAG: serine/threonine-protein kinase [Deltaproteobacteria bacterium]|jgi:serine/threonine protein kinase|nr:serine/threonine-protein kinase [Deltaproteobacteria bacterium]
MSNIKKVHSLLENSLIEFNYEDPKQGAVKDVYFHPGKKYVVAFFRDPVDANAHLRLERLCGMYRENIFGREGGDYYKDLFRWPQDIVEFEGKVGIVVPFYDPKFFFPKGSDREGSEKNGKWFASAKNFNKNVPDSEKGTLLGFLKVCLALSRAVARLHASGLAHSDLSYNNCLIDPKGGNACVIDIDGLVVPDLFNPVVLGTPDFIAPEVVSTQHLDIDDPNRILPNRLTDLHALAVLIYLYLFHRHPLRGKKVHNQDDTIQEKMEMGDKALFVEHPTDHSNRIDIQANDKDFLPWKDTKKLPYTIMGPYLKNCFDQAFLEGLHQPTLRPTADDWVVSLVNTCDLLLQCSNEKCVKKWFIYRGGKAVCPYCSQKYKYSVPVLDFYFTRDGKKYEKENHKLIVFNEMYIYPWHVNKKFFPKPSMADSEREKVGYFSFYKDKWVFVNLTLDRLMNVTTNTLVGKNKPIYLTDGLEISFSSEPYGRMARVSFGNQ